MSSPVMIVGGPDFVQVDLWLFEKQKEVFDFNFDSNEFELAGSVDKPDLNRQTYPILICRTFSGVLNVGPASSALGYPTS